MSDAWRTPALDRFGEQLADLTREQERTLTRLERIAGARVVARIGSCPMIELPDVAPGQHRHVLVNIYGAVCRRPGGGRPPAK